MHVRLAGGTTGNGGLTALFPREAVERIIQHGDRPVDARLITAHEDLADGLAGLHRTQRPDVLVDQVAHHADKLLWLLDRPMATLQRRRLDAIVVASHVQAGLLAFNLADRAGARRYFATAQSVAEDDMLCARALSVAVVLHSPIEPGRRGGDARRAVTRMREGVHRARRADSATRPVKLVPTDPRSSVLALTGVARARVVQGEPEQACQDLSYAFDLVFAAGYAMGVERIRGMRARFPKPWNVGVQ